MEGRELFREALASTLGKVRFRIGELGSCATSLPLLLPAIEIPCTRHAGIERHTKVFRVECCRTCIAATDELGVQLTAMPGRKFENPEPKLAFCTVALGCDGKSLNTALSQHVPSKLAPWATDDPKPGNPLNQLRIFPGHRESLQAASTTTYGVSDSAVLLWVALGCGFGAQEDFPAARLFGV